MNFRKPNRLAMDLASSRSFDPAFFDDERHHEALEQLAVQALSSGDFRAAFKYADRRCRIPPMAKAHHYVLRAEASYQTDNLDAALADIVHALELLPEDILANRRMLAWGDGAQQLRAAHTLLRQDHDCDILREAISVLRRDQKITFAAIEYTDVSIFGWATWSRPGPLTLLLRDGDEVNPTTIAADPHHPLAACSKYVASFTVSRPQSCRPQHVAVMSGKRPVCEMELPPNDRVPHTLRRVSKISAAKLRQSKNDGHASYPWLKAIANSPILSAQAGLHSIAVRRERQTNLYPNASSVEHPARTTPVTVIVPIYKDFLATKACLNSLLPEIRSNARFGALLIDDASPDRRIHAFLDSFAGEPCIGLLRNARNLGFVRSINHALDQLSSGDIILLNADTIVPHNFIDRLQKAARSSTDIGTVVPLSNNGEFTSFPVPNKPNPMLSLAEIVRLDAAAAIANADRLVDIPNGTGFCLYVTRECLDAVGPLSNAYERGYLEDADFCLRARERGFRNICASSIYVGHVGSRSFGAEKRSLVMRNLGTIESKFPDYSAECAIFIKADPLKSSRMSIESLRPDAMAGAVIVIAGSGPLGAVARTRAKQLLSGHAPALVLQAGSFEHAITLTHPCEEIPQSLGYDLSLDSQRRALNDYLRQLRPTRIEIAEPSCVNDALLDILRALAVPLTLLIADGRPFSTKLNRIDPNAEPPEAVDPPFAKSWPRLVVEQQRSFEQHQAQCMAIANRATQFYAPCSRSREFARSVLPAADILDIDLHDRMVSDGITAPTDDANAFGLLSIGLNIDDYEMIRHVAQGLTLKNLNRPIVVIGETIDDGKLMKIGQVFVTGAIGFSQLGGILRQYRIGALFAATRRPLFGHPLLTAVSRRNDFPLALFDWSNGRVPPNPNHLGLDPATTDSNLTILLHRWLN